jgi:hypothetical protein
MNNSYKDDYAYPKRIWIIGDKGPEEAELDYSNPRMGIITMLTPSDEPGYNNVYTFPLCALEMDKPREDGTYIGLYNRTWFRTEKEAKKWLRDNPKTYDEGNDI